MAEQEQRTPTEVLRQAIVKEIEDIQKICDSGFTPFMNSENFPNLVLGDPELFDLYEVSYY